MFNKIFKEIFDFIQLLIVDKVGVEEWVVCFQIWSIKNELKMQGLKMVLNMIDFIMLEGKDMLGKVKQLCYKGMYLYDVYLGLLVVVVICVYFFMVFVVKKVFEGFVVKVVLVFMVFFVGQVF